MQTHELRGAARRHNKLGPRFGGVYASDRLPEIPQYNAYIVNLDPASKPGSHWIAIYFDRRKESVDYFDSYGLKPRNVGILRFLKKNAIFKNYNLITYQGPCSTVCGQYCLYFLYHKANGLSMAHIQKKFNPMTKDANDRRVVRFARKHFKIDTAEPFIDVNCQQVCKSLLAVEGKEDKKRLVGKPSTHSLIPLYKVCSIT